MSNSIQLRIAIASLACSVAATCHASIFSLHRDQNIGERMLVCTRQSEGITFEIYRWRLLRLLGERALPLGNFVWTDNVIAVISKDQQKKYLLLDGMTGDSKINFDNFKKAPEVKLNKLSEENLKYYRDKDEPSNAACARSTLQFGVLILFSNGLSWDGGNTFYANDSVIDQNIVAKNWKFIQNSELIQVSIPPDKEKNPAIDWPLPVQMTGKLGMSARSVQIVDNHTVNVTWPLVMPKIPVNTNKKRYSEYDNEVWSREPSLLATYQITRGQQLWKLISLEQVGPLDVPEGMELILPKTVPLKKSYQPPAPKQ